MVSLKNNLANWLPYIVFLLVVIILMLITSNIYYNTVKHLTKESFANPEKTDENRIVTFTKNSDIYDKFYSKIYKQIIEEYNDYQVDYEITELIENTKLKEYGDKAKILDLGCGTGKHVYLLGKQNYNVVGLDQSPHMLDVSKEKTEKMQKVRLYEGNMDNKTLFGKNKFTHITCYYFSFYYSSNLNKLVDNVYEWLTPLGYFVVHLVDKHKFDPVLEASAPFPKFSIQKYSNKRQTKSKIYFEHFSYESDLQVGEDNDVQYIETFNYPERKYTRIHKHSMTMPNIHETVDMIKEKGFKLIKMSHMNEIGYDHQFICYFQKKK